MADTARRARAFAFKGDSVDEIDNGASVIRVREDEGFILVEIEEEGHITSVVLTSPEANRLIALLALTIVAVDYPEDADAPPDQIH
jgi:hypothetical protein